MSKFILRCLKNSHPDIELPNFVPVVIGRSPFTQITNKRLSKKHLQFVANISKKQVHCKVIGHNKSQINGINILSKNESVLLKPGDKIELLEGLYSHEIIFEEMESSGDAAKMSRKHWSQGLYASMDDETLLIYKDDTICIIKDKYKL